MACQVFIAFTALEAHMSPTVGRGVSHPRREIRVDGLSAREFEFECWPRARVSMVLGVWESILSFFSAFFYFLKLTKPLE